MGKLKLDIHDNIDTHVVDILGGTKGRDQPIMLMKTAISMLKMLDDNILKSDKYVFLDPFCKGGEIILASSFARNFTRSHLVNVENIKKDMFESRTYFGLAPDERHYRLSLRTFLGNKKSHIKKYQNIFRAGNYLSEVDGRLDLDVFKEEFDKMIEYISKFSGNRKIIAIGNPPYQENYKGNANNTGANSVYHLLLDHIIESKKVDQFLMVIPSRWFAGGRGKVIKNFAKKLRNSGEIKQIYDFSNSRDVFPTVDIKGGVCFLHWDSNHNGKTLFQNNDGQSELIDLSQAPIIIRDKISRSIVTKVMKKENEYIANVAWSWNPFGLASNYFNKNKESKGAKLLKCFTIRKVIKMIAPSKIKNADKVNLYKVVLPKAIKTGGVPYSKDQVFILGKKEICTETYMVISGFTKKSDAVEFMKYLQTDFVRFLLSIKKITHDLTKETWFLVPLMDMNEKWTDKKLFKNFGFSKDEINFIKSKASEWK